MDVRTNGWVCGWMGGFEGRCVGAWMDGGRDGGNDEQTGPRGTVRSSFYSIY